jgi:hypothetical protein
MAVTSGQQVIGLTRTAIDGVYTNPYRLHLHNNDNTKKLFVGGSDVTIANGFALTGLTTLEIIVSPNEQIYVVSENGDHPVSWLRMDV